MATSKVKEAMHDVTNDEGAPPRVDCSTRSLGVDRVASATSDEVRRAMSGIPHAAVEPTL
eukprot:5273210-Prymnesium_polylepis.2